MRQTSKLRRLLDLIHAGQGEAGIYALAQAAGRPYRRVHDQVRRLAVAGQVHLVPKASGQRKRLQVLPVGAAQAPKLAFNRAWSRPEGELDAETVIAQVLSRPTFDDLLACSLSYGIDQVRQVQTRMMVDLELAPGAAAASTRLLNNIELGHARAARRH